VYFLLVVQLLPLLLNFSGDSFLSASSSDKKQADSVGTTNPYFFPSDTKTSSTTPSTTFGATDMYLFTATGNNSNSNSNSSSRTPSAVTVAINDAVSGGLRPSNKKNKRSGSAGFAGPVVGGGSNMFVFSGGKHSGENDDNSEMAEDHTSHMNSDFHAFQSQGGFNAGGGGGGGGFSSNHRFDEAGHGVSSFANSGAVFGQTTFAPSSSSPFAQTFQGGGGGGSSSAFDGDDNGMSDNIFSGGGGGMSRSPSSSVFGVGGSAFSATGFNGSNVFDRGNNSSGMAPGGAFTVGTTDDQIGQRRKYVKAIRRRDRKVRK